MRILLINICLRYDVPKRIIPVGLACIATAIKEAGFKPDILDIDLYRYNDNEVDEFLKKNCDYDIVGFGNISSGYKYTKKLARQVKEAMPGAVLVVGNTVASSMPRLLLECVSEVDIAVIGEGDRTIVEIIEAFETNRKLDQIDGIAYRDGKQINITQRRMVISPIDNIPFPDYSLFEIEKYLSESYKIVSMPVPIEIEKILTLPINTARGCPFNCTFCTNAFKGSYRCYSFDRVIKYVEYLQAKYGINYVLFWDELTFSSRERLIELCDAIERANIEFWWTINARADAFCNADLELLERCRSLGALRAGGAIESADENILNAMNKKISIKKTIESMNVRRKAGLAVGTSLVFGYPQETRQSIKKTFTLCEELRIYPSAGFLLPLPGTQIYEYAVQNGFIKNEEEYLLKIGDRQDLHINLTKMSDEELFNSVKKGLIHLKNKLMIPLTDDDVIKTGVYQQVTKK